MARSKRRRNPFPNLIQDTIQVEKFTRTDAAAIFGGISRSNLSRDCKALGIPERKPLDTEDLWALYVLQFYMRASESPMRDIYVQRVNEEGPEFALEIMRSHGGSRQHFECLVLSWLEEQRNKQKVTQIQEATINVRYAVS